MYEHICIETERLVIRNFTENDIEQLHRIVNDETIMNYVPFAKERTLEDCKKLMKRILNRYSESTDKDFKGFLLLVTLKDSNECIGFAGLFPLTYDMNENELFYGLFKEYCGKGYATEIGISMIEYGFNNIQINKIVATVNMDNKVSMRVLDKMGMTFECKIEDEEAKGSSYSGELMYSIKKVTNHDI